MWREETSHMRETCIKTDFEEMWFEEVNLIGLAKDMVHWRDSVNTAKHIEITYKQGLFSQAE
jgi:hypothetical protein